MQLYSAFNNILAYGEMSAYLIPGPQETQHTCFSLHVCLRFRRILLMSVYCYKYGPLKTYSLEITFVYIFIWERAYSLSFSLYQVSKLTAGDIIIIRTNDWQLNDIWRVGSESGCLIGCWEIRYWNHSFESSCWTLVMSDMCISSPVAYIFKVLSPFQTVAKSKPWIFRVLLEIPLCLPYTNVGKEVIFILTYKNLIFVLQKLFLVGTYYNNTRYVFCSFLTPIPMTWTSFF